MYDDHDVVIVGGGPAGLAAAWELRDTRTLLLEANDYLGGRLKSEPRGNYWINLGGHLFPGPGSHMHRLITDLGLRTIPIHGNKHAMTFDGKVYASKRVETYPLTLPLSLRERIGLARAGLRIRAGVSAVERGGREAESLANQSFREFIGSPPERIDAIFRSAGRRAAAALEEQSAAVGLGLFGAVWAKSGILARNLDGGSGRFGEEMARALGQSVRYGARVTQVRSSETGVEVVYEQEGQSVLVHARHAILAVPAAVARTVVVDLPTAVRDVLGKVTTGPFLTLGILTSETERMPWDAIYAMTTTDQSFDMLFNHASPLRIGSDRRPGGSLMVYAGGPAAASLMAHSDEEIRDIYFRDLYALFPQLVGNVAESIVQRWPIGNVYRGPGMDFTPMLNYCERGDTSVHFCGDYFGVLGTMEGAATSGIHAAQRARSALKRDSGGLVAPR